MVELSDVLNRAKIQKATSLDGIDTELLKYVGTLIQVRLLPNYQKNGK